MRSLRRFSSSTALNALMRRHCSSKRSSAQAQTARWLDSVVIGKKLCPFAPPVRAKLRLFTSAAADEEEVVAEVATEARRLHQGILTPGDEFPETTLVVLPPTLDCTATWRDFVHLSWRLQSDAIVANGLAEHLQLVLFHPAAVHSVYADAGAEDAADFSIRSPFPTVHLLREVDMLAAVRSYPDAAGIPARNKARLRALGVKACAELWRGLGEKSPVPSVSVGTGVVASVALVHKGHVLLTREKRNSKTLLNLPGGKGEAGETLGATAAREAHEETGGLTEQTRAAIVAISEWVVGGANQGRVGVLRLSDDDPDGNVDTRFDSVAANAQRGSSTVHMGLEWHPLGDVRSDVWRRQYMHFPGRHRAAAAMRAIDVSEGDRVNIPDER